MKSGRELTVEEMNAIRNEAVESNKENNNGRGHEET